MVSIADPAGDVDTYHKVMKKKFPEVPMQEYANGVYAIDEIKRANWEAIEEFPPYETFIDDGQAIWDKPFANGKGYKDCFEKPGIYGDYPRWDAEKGMVTTLSLEINKCLEANGEKPMKYGKGKIASLLAYMAYESRGVVTNIEVPNDPGAMAAYEDGKEFYFKRRGQLNFSCANCHIQSAGMNIRSEKLSPALGHTSHFPVYRSKWGALGTLHRRFKGCNKQVRAKPFKMQGEEYRNLEYFLTHMSNGIVLNGPGARN
nr:sulfur oxidation c-type cytochrome SoxA [Candidatus Reidiella endopervernicosa]